MWNHHGGKHIKSIKENIQEKNQEHVGKELHDLNMETGNSTNALTDGVINHASGDSAPESVGRTNENSVTGIVPTVLVHTGIVPTIPQHTIDTGLAASGYQNNNNTANGKTYAGCSTCMKSSLTSTATSKVDRRVRFVDVSSSSSLLRNNPIITT